MFTPRYAKPSTDEAKKLLSARLARPNQHLQVKDGTDDMGQRMTYLPNAGALYETTSDRPARCPRDLRVFAPQPSRGGRKRIYCSATCKNALADGRRFAKRGEWRQCPECGIDFFTHDERRVLCPPPWPEPPNGESPCAVAHKRTLDARAAKAYRERTKAEKQATGSVILLGAAAA